MPWNENLGKNVGKISAKFSYLYLVVQSIILKHAAYNRILIHLKVSYIERFTKQNFRI